MMLFFAIAFSTFSSVAVAGDKEQKVLDECGPQPEVAISVKEAAKLRLPGSGRSQAAVKVRPSRRISSNFASNVGTSAPSTRVGSCRMPTTSASSTSWAFPPTRQLA
ncbi:MAG: hypothetical protein FJ102_17515 [Deltaproteobacteria bacterium]|nr:hypothetical protein [Deltaproteobacteria bacterium]